MGPDASARLYQRIIEKAREKYGAKNNEDYPELIIHSIPVPDFISNSQKAEEAIFMLKKSVRELSQLSPSCFALACNTAHLTLVELSHATQIPFISLPKEVAKFLARKGYKKIGLLGSPTTLFSGVYQTECRHIGVDLVLPEFQQIEELGTIISDIVAGQFKPAKKKLLTIADSLKKKKVEAIILGCTELPLVFPKNYSLPVLDSIEILSSALLMYYYQRENYAENE